MTQGEAYHPQFWIFGSVAPEFMPTARELGYVGVGYWAADREGERFKYYFDSPTLAQTDWAVQVSAKASKTTFDYAGLDKQGSGLAEYAAQAHAAGLKVMANMEGVNPYHWEAGRTKWTPENLSATARDLHACGADRWFTECMAGWPALMNALSDTCREIGLEYQEGSDPSYLHQWGSPESGLFPELFRRSGMVSLYHYHYRRDEMGKLASLAQESSLGYAFARQWGVPTALVYTVGNDWGESPEDWEGLLKASILIRALQFRVRDTMIIRESEDQARRLDVPRMTKWAQELVAKNDAEDRPVLNVVVHLRTGPKSFWRELANSGDAITSGAFHAGYDVLCTTSPLPGADAYYVYTAGADEQGTLDLTRELTDLFAGADPVFLQVGATVPTGEAATANWRKVLAAVGLDPDARVSYGDLPAHGVYDGQPFTYTGIYTAYELTEKRYGTILPRPAITGQVLADGNGTPLLIGQGAKYLIPAACLRWQMMYPLGHLLSGAGARPSSDVWGIAGRNVSALLAIHDTTLDLVIPKLEPGARIKVRQWDRHHQKTHEETEPYTGRYQREMKQFDFILIERQ